MGGERFHTFSLAIGESDLFVGYSGEAELTAVQGRVSRQLRRLRQEILDYPDSSFLVSLTPLYQHIEGSPLLSAMVEASEQANVGPMAAVAGAIAQKIGKDLMAHFDLSEVVIENGGDLYLNLTEPLLVRLLAPTSPFNNQIGVRVNGEVGVATSSARSGHSLSFGRADAVLVVSPSAALADALATAYCNKVLEAEDVQKSCERLVAESGVIGAIVALDETLAVGGELEVVRL